MAAYSNIQFDCDIKCQHNIYIVLFKFIFLFIKFYFWFKILYIFNQKSGIKSIVDRQQKIR